MINQIPELDPMTICLLDDAAKRKGISFGELVFYNNKSQLIEIASDEYAQQQTDDKLTGG